MEDFKVNDIDEKKEELCQEDIAKVTAKTKKTMRKKEAAKTGPENGFELIKSSHPSRHRRDLLHEDDSEEIELENQKSATQVPTRDFQMPKKRSNKKDVIERNTRNSRQFLSHNEHNTKIKSESVEDKMARYEQFNTNYFLEDNFPPPYGKLYNLGEKINKDIFSFVTDLNSILTKERSGCELSEKDEELLQRLKVLLGDEKVEQYLSICGEGNDISKPESSLVYMLKDASKSRKLVSFFLIF